MRLIFFIIAFHCVFFYGCIKKTFKASTNVTYFYDNRLSYGIKSSIYVLLSFFMETMDRRNTKCCLLFSYPSNPK